MNPAELWKYAEANNGLVITYDSQATATAKRHALHRYRRAHGGYENFQVKLDDKKLMIVPVKEIISTLDNKTLQDPSVEEDFEQGFDKLRLKLERGNG